jgi:hypothetical protein
MVSGGIYVEVMQNSKEELEMNLKRQFRRQNNRMCKTNVCLKLGDGLVIRQLRPNLLLRLA